MPSLGSTITFLLLCSSNLLIAVHPKLQAQLMLIRAIETSNEDEACFLIKQGADLESCVSITLDKQNKIISLLQLAALYACGNVITTYFRTHQHIKPSSVLDEDANNLLHYTWHPEAPLIDAFRRFALTKILSHHGVKNQRNYYGDSVIDFIRCYWPDLRKTEAQFALWLAHELLPENDNAGTSHQT